jgi:hypothetical protein
MHHPTVVAREPPKPREVEVEGVEETRRRPARDAVVLDREAASLELADERSEELMAPTGRRRLEGVEQRAVGPPPP